MDQAELEAVYSIFQSGMAAGLANPEKKEKLLSSSKSKLVEILGEENASRTIDRLNQCAAAQATANGQLTEDTAAWTINEQREKLKLISEAAVENDPVIKDLLIRLHKFNGRSKFARVSAKLVYTTLGLAQFAPTFIAPAAGLSLIAFMQATGGPEQDKLLREMYLYKCLESRYKTIGEEAHIIVTNAQVAALSDNKPLAACSSDLVDRLAGKSVIAKVFPNSQDKEVALTKVSEKGGEVETDANEAPAGKLD
jgi:hypothetical protein